MRAFIEAQPMFFVATAPSGTAATSTCRPRGANLFQVTGPLGFAYVDLMGSGIETVAHLRENGRIAMMFCAFEGPPKIVRLHGVGRPSSRATTGSPSARRVRVSDEQRRAVRSVIDVEVDARGRLVRLRRAADGYVGERDQLYRYADNRLARRAGRGPRVRQRQQRGEHRRPRGPRPAGRWRAPVSAGRKL